MQVLVLQGLADDDGGPVLRRVVPRVLRPGYRWNTLKSVALIDRRWVSAHGGFRKSNWREAMYAWTVGESNAGDAWAVSDADITEGRARIEC